MLGRRYTCEECLEGMEWIEAYFEDPIFQVQAKPKQLYKTTFEEEKTSGILIHFRLRHCSGLSSTGVMTRNRCVFQLSRCRTAIILINKHCLTSPPAPFCADARDGDGEVHDPGGDLQRGARMWRINPSTTNISPTLLNFHIFLISSMLI